MAAGPRLRAVTLCPAKDETPKKQTLKKPCQKRERQCAFDGGEIDPKDNRPRSELKSHDQAGKRPRPGRKLTPATVTTAAMMPAHGGFYRSG